MSNETDQTLENIDRSEVFRDPLAFMTKLSNLKNEALRSGKYEEAASNKEPEGLRCNKGKLKWSYVHFKSLEPMVRVLMFGAQKYEPFNWQKGLKKEEILESAMRHLTKLIDGEENDPESGLSHIGHLMCNCMFYEYMNKNETK